MFRILGKKIIQIYERKPSTYSNPETGDRGQNAHQLVCIIALLTKESGMAFQIPAGSSCSWGSEVIDK